MYRILERKRKTKTWNEGILNKRLEHRKGETKRWEKNGENNMNVLENTDCPFNLVPGHGSLIALEASNFR
jgi:hypothetical protein